MTHCHFFTNEVVAVNELITKATQFGRKAAVRLLIVSGAKKFPKWELATKITVNNKKVIASFMIGPLQYSRLGYEILFSIQNVQR